MTNSQVKDMTGQVFGELRVIERVSTSARRYASWLCECSCGPRVIVPDEKLRLKKRSCIIGARAGAAGEARAGTRRARYAGPRSPYPPATGQDGPRRPHRPGSNSPAAS